jgi:hypothetical protein
VLDHVGSRRIDPSQLFRGPSLCRRKALSDAGWCRGTYYFLPWLLSRVRWFLLFGSQRRLASPFCRPCSRSKGTGDRRGEARPRGRGRRQFMVSTRFEGWGLGEDSANGGTPLAGPSIGTSNCERFDPDQCAARRGEQNFFRRATLFADHVVCRSLSPPGSCWMRRNQGNGAGRI